MARTKSWTVSDEFWEKVESLVLHRARPFPGMGARRVLRGVMGAGLAEYDEMEGIEWEWQAIDGVMTKAPLGEDATGKNPTDRAKSGTKRSMLTDGAGIPLPEAVEGANCQDAELLVVTLEGPVVARITLGRKKTSSSTC